MTRGVPGVWYCCDMARRVGKEGKGGSTRLRPKWEKKLFRMEGCVVVKSEWSEWVRCSRLAIVAVSLVYCHSACCLVAAVDMMRCSENALSMKESVRLNTMRPAWEVG